MSHDETYQAMLLRKQREARKAYGVSQEMGDETEAQVESVMFAPDYQAAEDEQQAKFLREEGEWQERAEKAFCYGMLVGGLTALTVLVVTLWLVGVL
jgi:hypothetical protein